MARDPRYSRIKEAAKLQQALNNYHTYLTEQLTNQAPTGTPESQGEYTPLYAKPFAYALNDDQRVRESANAQAWTNYATHFANRTFDVPPAAQNLIRIRNYKLPRVSIWANYATTGNYQQSEITGLTYIKYGGQVRTIPFGHTTNTGTETQTTAFTDIRNALETVSANPPLVIYLVPERT